MQLQLPSDVGILSETRLPVGERCKLVEFSNLLFTLAVIQGFSVVIFENVQEKGPTSRVSCGPILNWCSHHPCG